MKGLIFLKLGGSLITDKSKPYTHRPDVIARLAAEIHNARKQGAKVLIGHGGGSYPHEPAKKYQTQKGLTSPESVRGLAIVQDSAARLNRIVVKALLDAGEDAISMQPSSFALSRSCRIVEGFAKPVEKALEAGMLPVVYGDVGFDLAQGCCILSTEEIFLFLAKALKPERILMAGKVDGVFTADPNHDPSAKLILEVTKDNFHGIKKYLTSSDGIDVTGGMLLKVERCLEVAESGSPCEIINGLRPGYLEKALSGQAGLGTVIR